MSMKPEKRFLIISFFLLLIALSVISTSAANMDTPIYTEPNKFILTYKLKFMENYTTTSRPSWMTEWKHTIETDALNAIRKMNLTIKPAWNYVFINSLSNSPSNLTYCFVLSNNATLKVSILKSGGYLNHFNITFNIDGPVLGYCRFLNDTNNKTDIDIVKQLVGRWGINLTRLRHAWFEGILPGLKYYAFYLGSNITFRFNGYYDMRNWAMYVDNKYSGDWIFQLPRDTHNYTALLAIYEPNITEGIGDVSNLCDRKIEGIATVYVINMSKPVDREYYVTGIGRIPPYDTAIGLSLSGNDQLYYTGKGQASELIKVLKDKYKELGVSGYYEFTRLNDSTVFIKSVPDRIIEDYSRYRMWNFYPDACPSRLGVTKYLPGTNIIVKAQSIRYLLPLVTVNNTTLVDIQPLSGSNPVFVYSKSYSLLVDLENPDLHLWLPDFISYGIFGPKGYRVDIWPLQESSLSLQLIKAEGLSHPAKEALNLNYKRNIWLDSLGFTAIVFALLTPLSGLRKLKTLAGLVLIVIGLSFLLIPYSTIIPTRSSTSVSPSIIGYNSRNYTGFDHSYFYTNKFYNTGYSFEGLSTNNCMLNIRSVLGKPWLPANSTAVISVQESGSLSISTGDPGLYRLDLRYMVNCSERAKESITFEYSATSVGDGDKVFLDNYRIPGVLLVILGIALILLYRKKDVSVRRGSLASWHLRSSYLNVASILIALLIVVLYIFTPMQCKIGGFCESLDPYDPLVRATSFSISIYLLISLYAVLVASIIFSYHAESGLDKRLALLGYSRLSLFASKTLAIILLVVLPYVAVRTGLFYLADPIAAYPRLPYMFASSLLGGLAILAFYAGFTILIAVVLRRTSYTLLVSTPLVILFSTLRFPAALPSVEAIVDCYTSLFKCTSGLHGFYGFFLYGIPLWVVGLILYMWPRREV
ncbi:MAG: hypothetical protein F7B59_05710 [Desulfurococcales archaeon]|nr:hypothetical protein [Desulfurococcales archaeon]